MAFEGNSVLTDGTGCVEVSLGVASGTIEVAKAGFANGRATLNGTTDVTVTMQVAERHDRVEVTAGRTPLALDASASSVRMLTGRELSELPGYGLDDKLRHVAGFQLFRRTSSWVANPTTQGTSLRGLGSTAASRTLVLSDEVPLNDAFGGWIHWNEIPQLAVKQVELMRGGASDLYGSSAIGGVIDLLPVTPHESMYALDLSGGTEDTAILNGLGVASLGKWSGLAAATLFRTRGYILTDPEDRGKVDVASNLHSQTGRLEVRRGTAGASEYFMRGNLLNEARGNGTSVQTNYTRLWRYAAGADWPESKSGRYFLRFHGARENYRQSFSAITSTRDAEKLTRLQRVPSDQLGGSGQWARQFGEVTLVAGGDVLDTRARDEETPVTSVGVMQATSTSARQRASGIYGEALWQPHGWSFAFSSRVDNFRSFDAVMNPGREMPSTNEVIFDPRFGMVKDVGSHVSLTASAFRAFRGPTMNELYRTGQVGQEITLPNAALRSERATGFELGTLLSAERWGEVRTSYFWTRVNRPVAAVTLASTPTSVLLERENLGQLESRGVTSEFQLRPAVWLSISGGYQYAESTVTKFQANASLVGKWTPQVPRNSGSLQVRVEQERWGVLELDAVSSGRQFDDSANVFRLSGYVRMDGYVERAVSKRWSIYGSAVNLLDRRIEAGRTPVLTLASPRTVAAGIKFH